MAQELTNGMMEECLLENTKTTESQVWASTSGPTAELTTENGIKVSNMVWATTS